jgi:hypothetical protein
MLHCEAADEFTAPTANVPRLIVEQLSEKSTTAVTMRDAADWFSVVAPAAANGTQRARKKSAKPTGTIHSNFIKTYLPEPLRNSSATNVYWKSLRFNPFLRYRTEEFVS